MSYYQFILEPYKTKDSRFTCPNCGKCREFIRYINVETGEHLHETVGKCNRESNCGYHYAPKKYFEDKKHIYDPSQANPQSIPNKHDFVLFKQPSLIPEEAFQSSLRHYENNNFVQFLIKLFGPENSTKLIEKYFIGTSKKWPGATVFWQIDITGKLRAGKIMLYNLITGKRVKEPYNHITWVHSALKLPEFNLQQSLFGEHLLKNNDDMVAIVESEKTAIIASIYLPQVTWLAAGSLSNLNLEKCKIFKNRKVILFPDLNGFEKWMIKAEELKSITKFFVSDLLERKATDKEKQQGLDLADYLLRYDVREFQQSTPLIQELKTEKIILIAAKHVIETAFIGTDGKFYIPNPVQPNRIAVYENPESYNKRLHLPKYVDKTDLENLFLRNLPINLETLQTIDL